MPILGRSQCCCETGPHDEPGRSKKKVDRPKQKLPGRFPTFGLGLPQDGSTAFAAGTHIETPLDDVSGAKGNPGRDLRALGAPCRAAFDPCMRNALLTSKSVR